MSRALALKALLPALCLVTLAAGCSRGIEQGARHSSSRASMSPQLDSMIIVVLNRPVETVRLTVVRHGGASITTLTRMPGQGRPGELLDSIGPVRGDPEMVRELHRRFDIWAMNEANAPGASCTTVAGQRNCVVVDDDYSVVMMVRSGPQVRVQRYIDLHSSASSRQARALGDFILAWAHERGGR